MKVEKIEVQNFKALSLMSADFKGSISHAGAGRQMLGVCVSFLGIDGSRTTFPGRREGRACIRTQHFKSSQRWQRCRSLQGPPARVSGIGV